MGLLRESLGKILFHAVTQKTGLHFNRRLYLVRTAQKATYGVKEKKLNFCGECKNFPCDTIMTKPHSTVLDKDWLVWKKNSERNG